MGEINVLIYFQQHEKHKYFAYVQLTGRHGTFGRTTAAFKFQNKLEGFIAVLFWHVECLGWLRFELVSCYDKHPNHHPKQNAQWTPTKNLTLAQMRKV